MKTNRVSLVREDGLRPLHHLTAVQNRTGDHWRSSFAVYLVTCSPAREKLEIARKLNQVTAVV